MPVTASEARLYFTLVPVICTETGETVLERRCSPCNDATVVKLFAKYSSNDTLFNHLKNQLYDLSLERRAPAAAFAAAFAAAVPSSRPFSAASACRLVPPFGQRRKSCSPAVDGRIAALSGRIEWPEFIAAVEAYRHPNIELPSCDRTATSSTWLRRCVCL